MSLPIAAVGAVLISLLETSVIPGLLGGGVKPDLVLVVAVAAAIIIGVEDGLMWAFLGGLMLDMLLPGRPLGATTFALLVVIGLAVVAARLLPQSPTLLAIGAVFGLSFLFQMLLAALLSATAGVELLPQPASSFLPIAITNTLVALVLAPIARMLIRRFGPQERMSW